MARKRTEPHSLSLFEEKQTKRTWKRSECPGGSPLDRMQGRTMCDRLTCQYHMMREIVEISRVRYRDKKTGMNGEDRAVESMRAWLEGEWSGHCVLDIAETGGATDAEIHKMLAIPPDRTTAQRIAESADEFRGRYIGSLTRKRSDYRMQSGDWGITTDGEPCRLMSWEVTELSDGEKIEAVVLIEDFKRTGRPLFTVEIDEGFRKVVKKERPERILKLTGAR